MRGEGEICKHFKAVGAEMQKHLDHPMTETAKRLRSASRKATSAPRKKMTKKTTSPPPVGVSSETIFVHTGDSEHEVEKIPAPSVPTEKLW